MTRLTVRRRARGEVRAEPAQQHRRHAPHRRARRPGRPRSGCCQPRISRSTSIDLRIGQERRHPAARGSPRPRLGWRDQRRAAAAATATTGVTAKLETGIQCTGACRARGRPRPSASSPTSSVPRGARSRRGRRPRAPPGRRGTRPRPSDARRDRRARSGTTPGLAVGIGVQRGSGPPPGRAVPAASSHGGRAAASRSRPTPGSARSGGSGSTAGSGSRRADDVLEAHRAAGASVGG